MAYTKQTWVDRAVEFANRFKKSNETTTSVTLEADPGTVTAAGTPVSKARMDHIEQGIADAHDAAAAAQDTADAALPKLGTDDTSQYITSKIQSAGGDTGVYWREGVGWNFYVGGVKVATLGDDGQLWDADIGGNKYWHSGNDGAGSGLDADYLDGQHGDYYFAHGAQLSGTSRNLSNIDLDDLKTPGYYHATPSCENTANGGNEYIRVIKYSDIWVRQDSWRSTGGTPYYRQLENGVWQDWKAVSGVKSIQRGVATIAATSSTVNVTISSVNMSKTVVHITYSGYMSQGSPDYQYGDPNVMAQLTSATNIKLDASRQSSNGTDISVSWQAVEHN